jgi:hypothetical protein
MISEGEKHWIHEMGEDDACRNDAISKHGEEEEERKKERKKKERKKDTRNE